MTYSNTYTSHAKAQNLDDTQLQKRSSLVVILLALVVLISAFAVIYVKDKNRQLFMEYQHLQSVQNEAYIEWGKLLLEESTLATQSRIQQLAENKLGFSFPKHREILVIGSGK